MTGFTFTYNPPEDKDEEDAEGTWTYNDEEFDVYDLRTALRFPTFTLTLCRLDGTNCIATVDGKTVALVSRSQTVDLIEAVNELTLGS